MGETSNYEIKCDGIDMVLTASDKVYRIFIPNSSYVFYEDDTVKLTAKQYSDRTIDYDKQSRYYIIATEIVSSVLADPSSADFSIRCNSCWGNFNAKEWKSCGNTKLC